MSNPNVEKIFSFPENEGCDKVVSLEKAIKDNIEPGIKIHIGGNPNAAIIEVLRTFWNTKPEFVIVTAFAIDRSIDMIYAGLVRKLITALCYEYAPTPGPSRTVLHAYKERRLQIENWSLFSIIQRLVAGAMGIPFMPIKSIVGSSIADENSESFKEIDDPFADRGRIGIVRALSPDISLIHGLAADRSGNTILALDPFSTAAVEWGALASRGGVVVTVEKLVTTKFIREHSSFVKIPSCLVKSVSEVPLGAHPQGLSNYGGREIEGYGVDKDFAVGHRAACDNGKLEDWIKEWILDCRSREQYLYKLGHERIQLLKEAGIKDIWKAALASSRHDESVTNECSPKTMMIVAAARKIREKICEHDYKVILAGSGVSALAAWVAFCQLRAENRDVDLIQGCGLFGYAPRPMDPEIMNLCNPPMCKMITDSTEMYGVFVNNRCLSVLGAAQIDKYGNINTTKTSDGAYLVGSGGANDAAMAGEVIIISEQSRKRFVDRVHYVTCPGDRVKTVVSSMGVFEKVGCEKELSLTGYYQQIKLGCEEKIKAIKKECGWNLKVAGKADDMSAPTCEELAVLRLFDPVGGAY